MAKTTKINLVSNPYKQEIQYLKFNEMINKWEDLSSSNPNSQLRSDESGKSFLPFKIKEIVDIIINDYYSPNDVIELTFQGTQDEFAELVSVCSADDVKDKLVLSRSNYILQNARYIFDDIKEIFETVHPVIESIVKDDPRVICNLNKVADALNDIIPICVFGNYSAGKSTFINALIGYEILPSGGDPVTAKIFKIRRSKQEDLSKISFGYGNEKYEISFEGDDVRLVKGVKETVLVEWLMQKIAENDKTDIISKIKSTLEFLNSYEKKTDTDGIGSVIEIEVPFSQNGIIGVSHNNFVIIDTPGSNTATYAEHSKVLEEALEGFSNGIPVWVSVYESIDSEDNANLCDKIENIRALDKRFTMIVLNKADGSDLEDGGFSKEQIREILEYNAVEKMYASGIYFVSSIMGLGAKNDGNLVDKHYRKIYRSQQEMYSNPEDVDYAMLYSYNIMPEQIKKEDVEGIKSCKNLIYANSGLYCVELEIEKFASKHSAYNKCEMVYSFLNDVVVETNKRIISRTDALKRTRAARENELDSTKGQLLELIKKEAGDSEYTFSKESKKYVKEYVRNNFNYSKSSSEIENIESQIRNKNFNEANYDIHERDYEESRNSLWTHFKANSQGLFEKNIFESLKELREDFAKDYKEMQGNKDSKDAAERAIDRTSSDQMLMYIINEYKRCINEANDRITKELLKYWYNNAQILRTKLIQLITESEALSVTQREGIQRIIINYQPLNISDNAEKVFIKKKFLRGVVLGLKLNDSERLNIKLLANQYNDKMKKSIDEMAQEINSSDYASFSVWAANLFSIIEANITEFNPQLRDMASMIREESEKINELENNQKLISTSLDSITELMSWKIVD